MRRKPKYKAVRRPPNINEVPTIGLREAAMIYNTGKERFVNLFFKTDLCDRIAYAKFPTRRGYRFDFREFMEAAFPLLSEETRGVMMMAHLRAEQVRRTQTQGKFRNEYKALKGA